MLFFVLFFGSSAVISVNYYSKISFSMDRDVDRIIINKFPEIKDWKSEIKLDNTALVDDFADKLAGNKKISNKYVNLVLDKGRDVKTGRSQGVYYASVEGEFEYVEVYGAQLKDLKGLDACIEPCHFSAPKSDIIDRDVYRIMVNENCNWSGGSLFCETNIYKVRSIWLWDRYVGEQRVLVGQLSNDKGLYVLREK